jgi:hypothetical protein
MLFQLRLVSEGGHYCEVLREDKMPEANLESLFELFKEVDQWVVQPFLDDVD